MPTERELFLRHLAQTSSTPLFLEIERAEGCWMYHKDGKKILDLISGIGVSSVGHRHPAVINAIEAQLKKHLHLMVYGEFVQSPQVMLAEKLSKLLPKEIDSFYFVNSGAEAIEGAMKLARRFTGREKMVAFKNSYHGSTQGAMSIMSNESIRKGYGALLPGISFATFNDEKSLSVISGDTACVIIEAIQGEAGVILPEKGFLKKVKERCDETGALLILDEIQTGFGRTGSFMAFESFRILPGILCMAKGMGGGMPIGCFASSGEIMKVLSEDPALGHLTTFGGNAVSCVAAGAVVDVLASPLTPLPGGEGNLISAVRGKSELFRKLLVHPKIKELRSAGLLIAVEFESREFNMKVISSCIENGVLTDWFLFNDKSMRIAPPLTITHEEIEFACDVIRKAIASAS